jgi:hypothetical protein
MQFEESPGESLELIVSILPCDSGDLEQVDQKTRSLIAELRDSDFVTAAGLVEGNSTPKGAKSPDAVTVGMLALAVLPTMLPRLVEFLQSWTLRWFDYKIRIKRQVGDQSLEIEYIPAKTSPDELQDLLDRVARALPHARQKPAQVKQKRTKPTT